MFGLAHQINSSEASRNHGLGEAKDCRHTLTPSSGPEQCQNQRRKTDQRCTAECGLEPRQKCSIRCCGTPTVRTIVVAVTAPSDALAAEAARTRIVQIHGHDVAYRAAGEGPVIVLIHGIAGSFHTWEQVLPPLARHHTVIAPDLVGHGESAKPRGDYSLGAYASGIRDLLLYLGHDRATGVPPGPAMVSA